MNKKLAATFLAMALTGGVIESGSAQNAPQTDPLDKKLTEIGYRAKQNEARGVYNEIAANLLFTNWRDKFVGLVDNCTDKSFGRVTNDDRGHAGPYALFNGPKGTHVYCTTPQTIDRYGAMYMRDINNYLWDIEQAIDDFKAMAPLTDGKVTEEEKQTFADMDHMRNSLIEMRGTVVNEYYAAYSATYRAAKLKSPAP